MSGDVVPEYTGERSVVLLRPPRMVPNLDDFELGTTGNEGNHLRGLGGYGGRFAAKPQTGSHCAPSEFGQHGSGWGA